MSVEYIEKFYSSEYVELIINYNGDLSILEAYQENGFVIVNFFLAIAFLPASEMTEDIVSQRGYAVLPNLFGLTSQIDLESSGVFQLRNQPRFNLKGNGVLIGVMDTGIDYTNTIFHNEDHTTRIASIWDQTIPGDDVSTYAGYGTVYTREQINQAIKSETPYTVVPSKDEIGHGTMIAGIAAGNEVPEQGFYGVASEAELVVVKLKQAKTKVKEFFRVPETVIAYQENDIIFGIQYLMDYAIKVNQPIVICIAIDTWQYAHDGRGTTSGWFSAQSQMPGICMLISVGNEGNRRRHFFGRIEKESKFKTMEVNVAEGESGFSMEIWGSSPNTFSVDITTPSGEYIPPIGIQLKETREFSFIFEPTILFVDSESVESQSGDQLLLFRFTNPTKGVWKFNVYGRGIYPMTFHSWLPMNNFILEDTYYIQSNPYTTLLSLSCAIVPIGVTAYDAQDESLYLEAGKGYTSIQVVKPDIAAPGVQIICPDKSHGFTTVSGTGAATAHAAGIAAMVMEWGMIENNYPIMNTIDVKVLFMRGARRKNGITYPNREWGYGILDVYRLFDNIRSGI